jgi:multidrug efflux pump subunit AcrA (membrane-fusion protein)
VADADDLSALKIEREPLNTGGGRWVKWVFLLLFLGGAGFWAFTWFTRERPIEVEVASVSERAAGTSASVLTGKGYVTARRRATVSSKVTGKVIEVNVEEGMAVRKGQVLARSMIPRSRRRSALSRAARSREAPDS